MLNAGKRATDEFGDVLFALVNFARFKDINPDEALERTNRRFPKSLSIHGKSHQSMAGGKTLSEMTLAEMNVQWEAAKKALAEDEKKG